MVGGVIATCSDGRRRAFPGNRVPPALVFQRQQFVCPTTSISQRLCGALQMQPKALQTRNPEIAGTAVVFPGNCICGMPAPPNAPTEAV
ncbi:MAG UNVERIFIED_CONTAM: hypothetical protein LVR18_46540 [Planctomycetaceae bacterium]